MFNDDQVSIIFQEFALIIGHLAFDLIVLPVYGSSEEIGVTSNIINLFKSSHVSV